MRSISIAAALMAASLCAPATATTSEPSTRDSVVYQEDSQIGENMDSFVARIAPRALATTLQRDEALCGLIAKDSNGQFSLKLITSGSPWKCTLQGDALPQDTEWTGLVFRTHTLRASDDWSESDMRHPGYLATERKLTYRNANVWRKLADF